MTTSRRCGLSVVVGSGKGWESEGWRAVVETARIAEHCGFHSIWLTDGKRDVHEVQPNPALVAAAVAVNTQRIRVRVETTVRPGSDHLRAAEDWSVVDNLSNARVELVSALGADRAGEQILAIRDLWSGKPVLRAGPGEEEYDVRTYPAPSQADLTLWLADSGDGLPSEITPEMTTGVFVREELAFDQIAKRVALLREQFEAAGGGPARLAVTAGTALGPEEIQEIHGLGVEEVVYEIDIEGTRDHIAETITALARASGLTAVTEIE